MNEGLILFAVIVGTMVLSLYFSVGAWLATGYSSTVRRKHGLAKAIAVVYVGLFWPVFCFTEKE